MYFLQFFCRKKLPPKPRSNIFWIEILNRNKLPPKPRSCQKLEKSIFEYFFTRILNRNKLPPKPRPCQKLAKILTRNKLPHLNQVIRWIIPNLTQKGGSKYRVRQGYGCIWRRYRFLYVLFFGRIIFTNVKVMKTQHIMSLISSCLIRIKWKAQIWYKREVLSIGFTKGMAAFGGGILFVFFCIFAFFFWRKKCKTKIVPKAGKINFWIVFQ